jgi:adenylate cyclase
MSGEAAMAAEAEADVAATASPAGPRWPAFPSPALDWLVHGTAGQPYLDNLFAELCARLVDEGLPLNRAGLHIQILHPQFFGVRMLWRPGMAEAEMLRIEHAIVDDLRFRHSPIAALYEGAEAIRNGWTWRGHRVRHLRRPCGPEGCTDYVAHAVVTRRRSAHAST